MPLQIFWLSVARVAVPFNQVYGPAPERGGIARTTDPRCGITNVEKSERITMKYMIVLLLALLFSTR